MKDLDYEVEHGGSESDRYQSKVLSAYNSKDRDWRRNRDHLQLE